MHTVRTYDVPDTCSPVNSMTHVELAEQGQNRLVCSYVEGVASYQIFTVCYHTAAKHVNVSAMSNLADEREIKHDATFPQLYG